MFSKYAPRLRCRCNLLNKSVSIRCLSDKSSDNNPEKENKVVAEKEYKTPSAGSYHSPWIILKEEVKSITGAFTTGHVTPARNIIPREADILVIGGGLVGNSVAYWLKKRNPKGVNVTIVERDYGYTRASSMLSAGGIRHQFSLQENIQMSMFTTDFIRNIREHLSVLDHEPPDVQFHHQGYMFLANKEQAENLETCVKLQRELGAKIELMSREKISQKFPWVNLEGIEMASYGTQGEGWFDPWLLLKAFRQKNVNNEVTYVKGEVVGFQQTNNPGSHIGSSTDFQTLNNIDIKDEEGNLHQMHFSLVINCAGAWAGEIAEMAGIGPGKDVFSIPLPVEPRKRFVYVIHCPNGPGLEAPLTVDTNGVYFRREGLGGCYICGLSPEEVLNDQSEDKEPDISNLDVDYNFFEEKVWPKLAYRYPQFEKIKLKSAWAGYYDYNYVDQNLIIGPHPKFRNFWFANGMSGHGVQQSVAIGRAIGELFYDHEYTSIDLSRFCFDRIMYDEPVMENFIV
ncbi:FAD-dependent oxidoreductase domain-containing protein 1-like isoform X1 [Mytilus californianus]|uniref:FAD-dependent oxidoreductase domain-containing protein 1-like isoform X1 n=1 Tax=Mytilus californianus TaxID=6549 RepID=UPI00224715BF|nr:FAD-dependent oxidoreductase domain-containing protein 1-like isoform X1 [Mytilus californianus]